MSIQETHKIDATNQILGRLASQVAKLLMGKASAAYKPNQDTAVGIEVTNIDKLKFSGNKINKNYHWRYSGYPGGRKQILLKEEWQKNPSQLFRQAVAGMLPANKLKKARLKRLKIVISKN